MDANNLMQVVLGVLAAYLMGSVSSAVVVSKLRGLADPRSYGSGNPGATNMLRSGDKLAAALTLLGDAAKGLLAVLLVPRLMGSDSPALLAAVALAVFLGHLWPVFFGFRGGKGVATALGVLLGLSIWVGLACLASWLLVFRVSRTSSLAALVAASVAPLAWWALHGLEPVFVGVLLMTMLLVWRHRTNIRALRAGVEHGFQTDRPTDDKSHRG